MSNKTITKKIEIMIIDFWTTNLNPLILNDSEGEFNTTTEIHFKLHLSSKIDSTQTIDYELISNIENKGDVSTALNSILS